MLDKIDLNANTNIFLRKRHTSEFHVYILLYKRDSKDPVHAFNLRKKPLIFSRIFSQVVEKLLTPRYLLNSA